MFFSTAPSLKNMINFVIGKQKACILMGPVSAIKVCNKALVDFAAELDFAAKSTETICNEARDLIFNSQIDWNDPKCLTMCKK